MQLKEFLDHYQSKSIVKNNSVVAFIAQETPSAVFALHVIKQLRSENYHIESIDVSKCSLATVLSQCQTSFLGSSLIYWLRGFFDIEKKYRHTLVDYLNSYQGPHQIIVFMTQEDAHFLSKNICIILPETVNTPLFISLLSFLKKKTDPSTVQFIQMLCNTYQKISLDQACMAINYMQVLAKHTHTAELLELILEPEQSLFTLSQHFFAKDAQSFFTLWKRFSFEYSPTFWCVFWADQLWRAYYAYYFLKQNKYQHAKNVGYKLPFTYMQKDWKKTSLCQLKNSHQFIYELDVAFKNNIEIEAGFDLFYTKFFLNVIN